MKKHSFTKVLGMVNGIRSSMGLKPLKTLPKGDIGSCDTCPLAKAFRAVVTDSEIYFTRENKARKFAQHLHKVAMLVNDAIGGDEWCVKLPAILEKFVADFDDGKYPELEN